MPEGDDGRKYSSTHRFLVLQRQGRVFLFAGTGQSEARACSHWQAPTSNVAYAVLLLVFAQQKESSSEYSLYRLIQVYNNIIALRWVLSERRLYLYPTALDRRQLCTVVPTRIAIEKLKMRRMQRRRVAG
jgi:hypothetical protein